MNSGRDPLSFRSSDPRTVWVFALDVPSKQAAEAFMTRTPMMTADGKGRMDWPVRDSLGVHPLDPSGLELTDLKKLREYGFARYLADANGMPEDKVMPDAAMLDALEGFALLVFSSALTGSDAQLAPKAPLRHIATYRERDPAPVADLELVVVEPARDVDAQARDEPHVGARLVVGLALAVQRRSALLLELRHGSFMLRRSVFHLCGMRSFGLRVRGDLSLILLPAVVLVVFGGVRNSEVCRLDWMDINLRKSTCEITADKAKCAVHARISGLPENAIAWLRPLAKHRGPIAPFASEDMFNAALKELRKDAGWRAGNWPRNALRATCISAHVASYQNVGATALWAGTSEAVIHRNYREVLAKDDGDAHFDVFPATESEGIKVVGMGSA